MLAPATGEVTGRGRAMSHGAFERVRLGTDSSGRPIVLTRRMKAAFDAACVRAGVEPVIIQGAFMAGRAAAASGHTHDLSGCLDTRTEDLTEDQQRRVLRAARAVGWAVWKRDPDHGGFEDHHHWLLLGERDMHPEARAQARAYLRGLDGLDAGGPDRHWRPDPIPRFRYRAPGAATS